MKRGARVNTPTHPQDRQQAGPWSRARARALAREFTASSPHAWETAHAYKLAYTHATREAVITAFDAWFTAAYPTSRAHRVHQSARQLLGKERVLDAIRDLTSEDIIALRPGVEA